VSHAFALFAANPSTFTLTLPDPVPLWMTCTATLPSTFLNALTLAPDGPPLVPTRTAPGLTCLLQFANAHSRFDGMTCFLSSEMRTSLEFVAPPCTPTQYRYAETLAFVMAS